MSQVSSKSAAFDAHLTDVLTNTKYCDPPTPQDTQAEVRGEGGGRGEGGRQTDRYGKDRCARQRLLTQWRRFPHAEFCHPREEHLAPLFVCAGAAGRDACRKIFAAGGELGIPVSSFRFGVGESAGDVR